MKKDIKEYGLKKRSKSFFTSLYKSQGWKSPIKHKEVHSLTDPMPRRGMLIMTNETPYD